MKKNVILFLFSIICCFLLTGCNQNTSGTACNTAEPEQTASPVPALPPTTPPEPDYKVCFIGNSLIEYGAQARFVKDIALSYGKHISVDQMTWGGSWLSDYVEGTYMNKKEVKSRLNKADIVVFQDYGGWQGCKTVKAIKKLRSWCKKDADCYYYMYEEDEMEMAAADYQQLKKMGIAFIPKGQMLNALYEMNYSYSDLHLEGDFHPNIFNGYVSALLMHRVIFKEMCTDFPKDWFFGDNTEQLTGSLDQVIQSLQGDSEQEKWDEFQRICQKADELAQQAGEFPLLP